MSKSAFNRLAVLLVALCVPAWSDAAVLYRSDEGWSVEGDPASQVESSAAAQMRKAENFESAGDKKSAYSAYRALVKKFASSNLAPKAQRKVGILLEQHGDYDPAFEAYSTYLTKYPNGEDFDSVVESMYKIAKLFLEGQKKKLFGVPIAASMARATEMFETILKRAPFSKWAPLAQFNLGQAEEKQGKYPEATAAYQQVVAKYGSDSIAADAQYQIGYVLFRQLRDGSNDRATSAKAREAFEDFINRYPNSEKVAQARENLKQLEGGTVKGALGVAKYYDKMKQYKAAVIYYNDVIKQQPGTADAEFAKARIETLKSTLGEDALRAGPERAETGARAAARRKMQAKVDTTSRPDFVGPPVFVAEEKIETAPGRPKLRTSPSAVGPAVEPPLPDKLPTQDTGLPKPPQ